MTQDWDGNLGAEKQPYKLPFLSELWDWILKLKSGRVENYSMYVIQQETKILYYYKGPCRANAYTLSACLTAPMHTLPLQQQLPTTQLSSQQQEQKLIGHKCCITTCANSPQQLRAKYKLLSFICPVFAARFIWTGLNSHECHATYLVVAWKKNKKQEKPPILFSYPLNHWPSQKRLYQHLGLADPTAIPPNLSLYQLRVVSLIKWVYFSHTVSLIFWVPSPWTKIKRVWASY